jgi:hypothetical protein
MANGFAAFREVIEARMPGIAGSVIRNWYEGRRVFHERTAGPRPVRGTRIRFV